MQPNDDRTGATAGEELSSDDIELLCDIGDFFPEKRLSLEKQRRLQGLIAKGFVEKASVDRALKDYQLTAKAQKLLAERGLGLNEA